MKKIIIYIIIGVLIIVAVGIITSDDNPVDIEINNQDTEEPADNDNKDNSKDNNADQENKTNENVSDEDAEIGVTENELNELKKDIDSMQFDDLNGFSE